MNNIFLIVSNDKVTLDEKVKSLLKDNPDSEIVNYNLINTNISRVIEDLDTINFLSNKKIIIASNAFFLGSEKVKSDVEHNLDDLEKYLNNPNPDNILILVNDTIDKRKKIVVSLMKQAILIEEIQDINEIIKKRFEGYKISKETINKLIDFCMNDHERILNEIEKLKMYKVDTKEINYDDIDEVVLKTLDDNIFHFVDCILSKDKKQAFKLYNNFKLHGQQIVGMLGLISNKIRLIYQVKVLTNLGNTEKTISKILKVHEYPVKLAHEASYKYTERTLLEDLDKLAEIDLLIKSGVSDGEVEFETLLATI